MVEDLCYFDSEFELGENVSSKQLDNNSNLQDWSPPRELSVSLVAITGLDHLDTFMFHLDPSKCFPINILGNKHIQCKGVVQNVELIVEYYTLKDDFYLIDIRGVDVVLGIWWLYSLGTYTINYHKQFLSFHHGLKHTITFV